jgi:hypothetical protein
MLTLLSQGSLGRLREVGPLWTLRRPSAKVQRGMCEAPMRRQWERLAVGWSWFRLCPDCGGRAPSKRVTGYTEVDDQFALSFRIADKREASRLLRSF